MQPIPVRDIALQTGAEIIGTADGAVRGMNEIHNVAAGDLTFVDHEKYYSFVLASAASFILINKKIEAPAGKTLLYTTDPFKAYNDIAISQHPTQHSSASIAATAKIGEGTIIYPNAFVGEHVTIGRHCIIYPNVTIYAHTVIGDNVIIHGNSTIGADAFYYKGRGSHYDKMHTIGRTVIHDDVEIGSGCTIDAGVSADTVVGKGTKMDSQVHIGHDATVGEHCILCAQVGIAGNVRIGNHVTMYGKSALSKNISVGDRAVLLGSSASAKSLEGGKTYLGTPADEVHRAARQFAIIKMLPDLWDKLRKL
ncbi:MAG: UDP-3-O-(3-hydroxymyristoyl)glucosamine N-acyltransferase [Bacteroidetes bacterium]|nr:UDP-3-O-(3-hydroxymyristoyl)glucosamine N-acyltransferase [Bacteroidota bacterium]